MRGHLLRELAVHLFRTDCESIVWAAGYRKGRQLIVKKLHPLQMRISTPVCAEATPGSCRDAIRQMHLSGMRLLLIAHSQPGNGESATLPSLQDLRDVLLNQINGGEVVGLVFVRSGHLRLFSAVQPFRAVLKGAGITYLDRAAFHVQL